MQITPAQLDVWLLQFLLPFARIAGLLMVAPIFGMRVMPARLRLMLALLITVLLMPQLPVPPMMAPFKADWWLSVLQQVGLGIVMGFVLQLVFEAVMMGGELISSGMGLSFAQMADPVRGGSSPVVGQFLRVLALLIFLSLHGHLTVLELLAQSFHTLPVGPRGLSPERLEQLALFGSHIFAGGLRIALPMLVALLTVNLAFGVMSRAAPSLNLMAVGFPAALIAGLLLLWFTLETLLPVFGGLLQLGFGLIDALGAA